MKIDIEESGSVHWFRQLTGTVAHGLEMLGRMIFNLPPGAVAFMVTTFRPENPFRKKED